MARRIVIVTEGYTNPSTAKTACSLLRYRPDEVLAVLDSSQAGKTTQELLNVGGGTPIVASMDEVPSANTLLIGIEPPTGHLPGSWRSIILDAISRKWDVVSGLHDFLSEQEEYASAAQREGVTLVDVRKNNQQTIARRLGFDETCFRIHTVGNDCSVGKMVTGIELTTALEVAGHDAKFVATGQTGIMIEGNGCPVDRVVADFVAGSAEQLVLDNQHHEILVVEGQGSLVHPAFSGVTLGLLHGCAPHALIMCYEVGRSHVINMDHIPIPSLDQIIPMYELMASIVSPCKVIGIAMNSWRLTPEEREIERQRVSERYQVPVVDVLKDSTQPLIDAILNAKQNHEARIQSHQR
jgi:uncharacterized NAD-dependent epimerase/dehydratase family protein